MFFFFFVFHIDEGFNFGKTVINQTTDSKKDPPKLHSFSGVSKKTAAEAPSNSKVPVPFHLLT